MKLFCKFKADRWISDIPIRCLALTLSLSGCGSYSGVVPMGPGAYMSVKQAPRYESGLGTLKADIVADADKFCKAQNKQIRLLEETESSPPFVAGNYPRAEIKFVCLSPAS